MHDLIDKEKYQVFLLQCPAIIPFNFATHHWFVVNQKGVISRWEVSYKKHPRADFNCGYLYKNSIPPFQGIRMFGISEKPAWKPKLLAHLEGEEGSTAEKMAAFINEAYTTYPYCNEYSLFGATSNTYVQWILDEFPEIDMKLPWNAFGKDWRG